MMIEDALLEMERLEKDYESLKIEIRKNGENKQITHVEFGVTCFHEHLCYGVGTILYGTIFRY